VISWAGGLRKTLDLFIELCRGLMRELVFYADSSTCRLCLSWSPGSHGQREAVDGYKSILIVASGFGIAAQLLYLKRLIQGHNTHEAHTRRIHLAWELWDVGERAPIGLPFIANMSQK
jgi:hypothetical protein